MALTKKDLKPIETNIEFARKTKRMLKLAKLPILKQILRKKAFPPGLEQAGRAIPINTSLNVKDQVLPFKLAEHFIQKAGTILIMDCPCRTKNECKDHDITLGCTWLGKGAGKINMDDWPGARLVSKEEAMEHERKCYENGLVPHLGKFRGDARLYDVMDYENEFMSICHCCPCCCIVSLAKYSSGAYKQYIKRLEGVEVKVDPDKCQGCGDCFKVCIYAGLDLKNDQAVVNQENCLGCGRCVRVCPDEAISITIEDYEQIEKTIARFESIVDISN